jgi:hypothetical protein
LDTKNQAITRLKADGSFDPSFVPPVMNYASGNGALRINALAVDSNGKILLGGNPRYVHSILIEQNGTFSSVAGQTRNSLALRHF